MNRLLKLSVVFGISLLLNGCSSFVTYENSKTLKDKTIDDMYPILSDEQLDKLKGLATDQEVNDFLNEFWKKCDPSPGTAKNELKDEYEKRLAYANKHFPDKRGWGRSDMKRIYLQNGAPDDIVRSDWSEIAVTNGKRIKAYEIWVYFEPAKNSFFPYKTDGSIGGPKRFLFADLYGSKAFKLLYSSEDIQDIDAILERYPN
ncbi:MAG: GWxTD domain-containing protein [Clostridiales bacterium]